MKINFLMHIIISIILFVGLFYFGYENLTVFLSHNPNLNMVEFCYVMLPIIVLSFVAGIYIMMFFNLNKKRQLTEYQRELERRGIDRDNNASQIKILESKISVLEKALQDALKK